MPLFSTEYPEQSGARGQGTRLNQSCGGWCCCLAPEPLPTYRWSLTLRSLLSLQYGFVNHALELLVIRNYGPEVWEDIK